MSYDKDFMPENNRTFGTFTTGIYRGPRAGEWGKVFHDVGDPVHTHVHGHPDGITISSKYPDGRVERFDIRGNRGR